MPPFTDKKLVCKDCGNEFLFSAGEQAFHAQHGLRNEPRRCAICREMMRMRNDDKRMSMASRSDGPRGPGGPLPPRTTFRTTCGKCGKPADVPFKPKGDRPVLCRDCFRAAR